MANDTAQRLMTRVRELRQALGLSQEAFAERAGLQYKHYQAVEAGRKLNLTLPTLEKMANACGIELWELLNFDSAPAILAESPPKKERGTSTKRRRKS